MNNPTFVNWYFHCNNNTLSTMCVFSSQITFDISRVETRKKGHCYCNFFASPFCKTPQNELFAKQTIVNCLYMRREIFRFNNHQMKSREWNRINYNALTLKSTRAETYNEPKKLKINLQNIHKNSHIMHTNIYFTHTSNSLVPWACCFLYNKFIVLSKVIFFFY